MTNPDKNNLSEESCRPQPEPGEAMPDLSTIREEKGLSLADVFARTRISKRNLTALEQGDFAVLPHDVYTRAFIRQYAELLEIDPQPFLAKYAAYLKTLEDPQPTRKNEGPVTSTPQKSFVKKLAGVLAVLFVVMTLSFVIYNQSQNQPERSLDEATSPDVRSPALPPDQTSSEPVTQPAEAGGAVVASPVPASVEPSLQNAMTPPVQTRTVPSPPQTANIPEGTVSGTQKLTIQAREISWIGIRIGRQERQQVMLHPGDTVTYEGNRFRLDIGNAGGVDIFLDAKPLPPLGSRGQVVHVTLP